MREGVPIEERKRRLPAWITEVAAGDQTGKDRTGKKTECRLEDGVSPLAKLRHDSKRAIAQKDTSTEDLSSHANLERKGRKRQQNPHCDNIVTDDVPRKKTRNIRRKVQESDTENLDLRCTDAETSSLNDVEGELTVEDLISIAEEYVKADEGIVGLWKQIDGESTGVSLSTTTPVADATEGSHDPPDSQNKFNHKIAISGGSTESWTVNDIVCGTITRTGDPAQDMLGVFLGSLLNKPPKEKEIDFSMEKSVFDCEIEKNNQSNGVEELLQPTRKKSSLKEKVAMFFE